MLQGTSIQNKGNLRTIWGTYRAGKYTELKDLMATVLWGQWGACGYLRQSGERQCGVSLCGSTFNFSSLRNVLCDRVA